MRLFIVVVLTFGILFGIANVKAELEKTNILLEKIVNKEGIICPI